MKKLLFCFLFLPLIGISQEISEEKLDVISREACECIAEISHSLSVELKNEEISDCITSAISSDQLYEGVKASLISKKDSLQLNSRINDSLSKEFENIITIDETANYDKIQQNLLERCPAMRFTLETNNDKSDVSVSDKKEAKDLYDKADGFYRQKDYNNAKKYYKQAVRKDKNFAFAWDMLGLSQRNLGEYKDAIKSYEKSLKIDPSGKVPLQNMGVAYQFLEDYENAIKTYKIYIRKYPDDPEGFYGIARMYSLNGDFANGADSIMQAYLLYKEIDSPYINDAISVLSEIYKEMVANDQLETFQKLADKYNITIE